MEFISKLGEDAGISLENDIEILDESMFDRIIQSGNLGLGETYMDGQWRTKNKSIDELIALIGKSKLKDKLTSSYYWKFRLGLLWLWKYLRNPQTIIRSRLVAQTHYDLGNELFEYMLDPYMMYSCAKFGTSIDDTDLNTAQINKLETIARKLKLKPGDHVLDIGCGWGGLAQYLAENHGVYVDGITISIEQFLYADEHNNFKDKVTYYLKDYRDTLLTDNKYDAIVSVGMFEHVGPLNYSTFMQVASKNLNENGVFLLHTIGRNISGLHCDPWLAKYIFPNSCLPSLKQICETSEGLFVIEDVENFGVSYDKTLLCWHRNFVNNFEKINEVRVNNDKEPFDLRFYRMWEYYLLSCAGTFRSRDSQLFQIILSKGIDNGYVRP